MAKELTHEEIYDAFCRWSPEHAAMIKEYRPWGRHSIVIWLKNGMAYKAKHICENKFVLQTLSEPDIYRKLRQ